MRSYWRLQYKHSDAWDLLQEAGYPCMLDTP